MVAGTLLTKRDTFLTRAEYMQLLYAGCGPTRSGVRDAGNLLACFPAVVRPHMLWTGKQVGERMVSCSLVLAKEAMLLDIAVADWAAALCMTALHLGFFLQEQLSVQVA